MKPAGTWRWALGNKRQKKKVRMMLERGCGCGHCCPEDRRQKIKRAADLSDAP